MVLTLWRHSDGCKTVIECMSPKQARRAYFQHVDMLDHPLTNYYRVTLHDPLAGDRILADSDRNRLEIV